MTDDSTHVSEIGGRLAATLAALGGITGLVSVEIVALLTKADGQALLAVVATLGALGGVGAWKSLKKD